MSVSPLVGLLLYFLISVPLDILGVLSLFRECEVSLILSARAFWFRPDTTCMHAYTLFSGMHGPISWPSSVRLERSRYHLLNWGDMPNNTMISVHMHAAIYACLHAYTLFSCIHRPSSLSNFVWSERYNVYMELWDHTDCVWPNNPTQMHKLASCILEIFFCYIVMSTTNDKEHMLWQ